MRGLELLKRAIDKKEFNKFLLGEGIYQQTSGEMDRGIHSIYRSWSNIIEYIEENGEDEKISLIILDKALCEILNSDKTIGVFLNVIMYLWCYCISIEESDIKQIKWYFSNELITNVKNNYKYIQINNLSPQEKRIEKEAQFDYRDTVRVTLNQLKNRFGIDFQKE